MSPETEIEDLLNSRKLHRLGFPLLVHRDLSWVQFNERVLEEAELAENPLLERIKFLAISSSNLDEFFMVRVATLERSIQAAKRKDDAITVGYLSQVRETILSTIRRFHTRQDLALTELTQKLSQHHIKIVENIRENEGVLNAATAIYRKEILPLLAEPSAFSENGLEKLTNLQTVALLGTQLCLPIPTSLKPIYAFQPKSKDEVWYFFLDDLLMAFLPEISSDSSSTTLLRLTRDADLEQDLDTNDPESIPDMIRTRLSTRERGRAIRLQIRGNDSESILPHWLALFRLPADQIYNTSKTLFMHSLWTIYHDVPEKLPKTCEALQYPALQSRLPAPFASGKGLIDKVKEHDILLHHPYDSFDAFVSWITEAAHDPLVTQIELTIYRVDAVSPLLPELKKAAKTKVVIVVIELRARFDELNNLQLAEELKKAGVKVHFGFGQLKLHAKIALITRQEGVETKLYTHLSTGNYNAKTARQYTDLAIITANPHIGKDARIFFDAVEKGEIPHGFKKLVVAPTRLARRMMTHIQEEIDAAKQGKPARIFAKVNALVDEGIINSLYEASQAGVKVDLIVRGACSLLPGIKGLSENIHVYSIVDRFLEHSRIYYFGNSNHMYFSSADWMPRNLFRRLEVAFPILDPLILEYLKDIVIPAYLSDRAKSRELTSKGVWELRAPLKDCPRLRSQVLFRELALREYHGTPLYQRRPIAPKV